MSLISHFFGFGDFNRVMCGLEQEHCSLEPQSETAAIIGKINNLYGTYYRSESSVLLTDCQAALGGVCVIDEYSQVSNSYDNYGENIYGVKMGLFAPDGRRASMDMRMDSFESLLASGYFSNGRTHELLKFTDNPAADRNNIDELMDFMDGGSTAGAKTYVDSKDDTDYVEMALKIMYYISRFSPILPLIVF